MLKYSSNPDVQEHIALQIEDGATGKICLTSTLDVNRVYKVYFSLHKTPDVVCSADFVP